MRLTRVYVDTALSTGARCEIDGNAANTNQNLVGHAGGQVGGFGVAADAQHFYWANGGNLMRSDLNGQNVVHLATLTAGAWMVVVLIPLIVGVWPVRTHQLALRLHNEVPGIVVPEHVQEALLRAGPDAPDVGAELTRALIARAREERYAGVYVVAPFRRPLGVIDFLAG